MSPQKGPWLKMALSVLLVFGIAMAVAGLASGRSHPLQESPSATVLTPDAPLGRAMYDLYIGQSGVYNPKAKIVQPDVTHFPIQMKAAHNGKEIFIQYTFPTPRPSYYIDYVVYKDGKWVRTGASSIGLEPHGIYEDRISMLLDDGSVKGFANQAGWLTCHQDLRDPYMFASAKRDEIMAHPVIGQIQKRESIWKYIPQSRDSSGEWWQFSGWDAVTAANMDRYKERHQNGVFLDFWHWRPYRSNPVGFSDNSFVFDYRSGGPGTGSFVANWNAEKNQPNFMFDPKVTGSYALNWEKVQAQGYSYSDYFYLARGINAVPFDPNHQWKDGDVIPRWLVQMPTENRAVIRAQADLKKHGENDWTWTVELRRALDTGYPLNDKVLKPGRTYDAAVAVHRLATGSRWHYVSLPFTIGLDVPGTVKAGRFTGERPDWASIPASTITVVYPGQTNWQWITSDKHPGATQVRADTMSVAGCHDEAGLGAANKAVEARITGVEAKQAGPGGPLTGVLDPANAVFLYLVVAVGTIVGSIGLGRLRSGRK
jgi:hypothetical protein